MGVRLCELNFIRPYRESSQRKLGLGSLNRAFEFILTKLTITYISHHVAFTYDAEPNTLII